MSHRRTIRNATLSCLVAASRKYVHHSRSPLGVLLDTWRKLGHRSPKLGLARRSTKTLLLWKSTRIKRADGLITTVWFLILIDLASHLPAKELSDIDRGTPSQGDRSFGDHF